METNVQNTVNKEQETMALASVWTRFLAELIDGLLLIIPALVLNFIPFIGKALTLAFGWLYYAKMEELTGATFGKRWLGIQVVTEDGSYQTFWQASLRYLVKHFVSGILLIGYIMAFFTEKRQSLHDIIAKTYVVQKTSDALPSFNEFVDSTKKTFSGVSIGAKNDKTMEQIEKLKELLDNGIITEEEFEQKKKELLEKIK